MHETEYLAGERAVALASHPATRPALNAAKYANKTGDIPVCAAREGGELVLRARDTGLGIAPEL